MADDPSGSGEVPHRGIDNPLLASRRLRTHGRAHWSPCVLYRRSDVEAWEQGRMAAEETA